MEAFGLFKSGIGIHYTDSMIVSSENQSEAKNLVVGRRFPPEIVICAADDRTIQIHDLIRSDTAFKLFVFTGDLSEQAQRSNLQTLAERLASSPLFMKRLLPKEGTMQMVDIFSVVQGKRGEVRYTDIPETLRSHWSKYVLTFPYFISQRT